MSRRDEAGLAVVAPIIRSNGIDASKDFGGVGKVEPTIGKSGGPLGRIVSDPHVALMYPRKWGWQWGYKKIARIYIVAAQCLPRLAISAAARPSRTAARRSNFSRG